MHEEPQVPNFGRPGTGPELIEGLVIAIEPMVNAGRHEVIMGEDGWTITTKDGSLSAHWEHTVAVTGAARGSSPWPEGRRGAPSGSRPDAPSRGC